MNDSTTTTTRIGVLGLGWIGHHEASLVAELDGVDLVGGVDTARQAREEFESELNRPAYESYEAFLAEQAPDLDGLIIATPHASHFEQAMAAVEHGIDVLVEKPMTTSLEDALGLVAAAERADALVQVGYQRRFHEGYRAVKQLLESDRLGSIRMVSCYLGQSWLELNADSWRTDPVLAGGGQLYDTGSHMLETLLWSTDLRPVRVTGVMDDRGLGVDVNSALAVEFDADGETVVGTVAVCSESADLYPDEGLVVWGTDGRLKYDSDGRLSGPKERLRVVTGDAEAETTSFEEGVGYRALTRKKVENFVAAVRGDAEPAVDAEFGLRIEAFRTAARTAWETGSTVDVEALVADADPVP